MALFPKSVLTDYKKKLNKEKVDEAFKTLKSIFNEKKQMTILNNPFDENKPIKEEEYQEGFCRDLFGSVFGYTVKPDTPYHLRMEKKSTTNNSKADGAIIKYEQNKEQVLGVVELKSPKLSSLNSVEEQVFKYFIQHQSTCRYAITSNFQLLRVYIDDYSEYEEFDIFKIVNEDDDERFEELYLYLNKDFVLDNLPAKFRNEALIYEKKITNELYKIYSDFRLDLFEVLEKTNTKYDKGVLLKKTQKIIDRFLFVLFAEDKELLPKESVTKQIDIWKNRIDKAKVSLFDHFKEYFNDLNSGNPQKGIFAFNGGLFAKDELIDNLKMSFDERLMFYLDFLQKYDFKSEVDVEILGHIFEQSLNDLEEIIAKREKKDFDKSKTKRKKEGVFYTPQYITRYIVDNTVGALCRIKKEQLGYITGKSVTEKQLKEYRDWLFTLKIIDPACGSGAFLNQVLTFLIAEHERIDERIAGLKNRPIIRKDYSAEILEKNIFGVDLNEEAVEIAKLSLWLRTAKKEQKLSNLNNNIKVGNSLILYPMIFANCKNRCF